MVPVFEGIYYTVGKANSYLNDTKGEDQCGDGDNTFDTRMNLEYY